MKENFKAAQQVVACGLTAKSVDVYFDTDSTACVELENHKIHLPELDMNPKNMALIRAYLDHEAAHILFTAPEACKELSETQFAIFNAIEDGRINALLGQFYEGCRQNIIRAQDIIKEENQSRRHLFETPNPVAYATLALIFLSQGCDVETAMHYVGGSTAVSRLLSSVSDIVAKFPDLKSAHDSRECALKIHNRWLKNPSTDRLASLKAQALKEWPFGALINQDIAQDCAAYSSEGGGYISEIRKRLSINDEATETYTARTCDDEIVIINNSPNDIAEYLYQEVKSTALFRQIENDLKKYTAVWVKNSKAGRKLDDRKIYRVGVGDGRIFKRKNQQEKLDTAMTMLIDFSGSMARENRIFLAIQLAMIFSETCERLDIPNEVLGFTTKDKEIFEIPRTFTRLQPLRHLVIKQFHNRFKQRVNAFGNATETLEQNVDGESLLWAADRLRLRKEKDRKLIVLSDGLPHDGKDEHGIHLFKHLKKSVRVIESTGIQCVGIGIKSKEVSLFYKDFLVIEDLETFIEKGYEKFSSLIRNRPK